MKTQFVNFFRGMLRFVILVVLSVRLGLKKYETIVIFVNQVIFFINNRLEFIYQGQNQLIFNCRAASQLEKWSLPIQITGN